MLEEFRYRHLGPFRYLISKKHVPHPQDSNPRPFFSQATALLLGHCADLKNLDVGYWISDNSLFRYRYNVGLRALQSDIGSSVIKLSPITLIMDIGVSGHLCKSYRAEHREAVIASHSYRSGDVLAIIASKIYCFDS
jgi:hypothetical protein